MENENYEQQFNKGSNSKNIIIIVLSVLVITLIGFLVGLTVFNNRDTGTENVSDNTGSNISSDPTTQPPSDHGHGHNHAPFDVYEVTVGNISFTAAEYSNFFEMIFHNAYQFYFMSFGEEPFDLHLPLDQQMNYERGITWAEYFHNEVLDMMLIYANARAEGFDLTDDDRELLADWAMDVEMMAMMQGMTPDELIAMEIGDMTWEEYVVITERQFVMSRWAEHIQRSLTFSREEMEDFFNENWEESMPWTMGIMEAEPMTVDIRHILIMNNDDDTALEIAEDILAEWHASGATEELFAQLATERTEDPGSRDSGGLYQFVSFGQMVPEFNDWIFDDIRQYGDYDIVQTDFGYHIMFFVQHHEFWMSNVNAMMQNRAIEDIIAELPNRFNVEARLVAN